MVSTIDDNFCYRQILEVLARVRDEEEEYLCNQIYKNSMKVFFPYEL